MKNNCAYMIVVLSGTIPREYNNNQYKYYHLGSVYTAPSSNSTVMDYFRYINNQVISPQ